MLLWIAFALMTAAVLAAVLRPLARPSVAQTDPADAGALDVYRHQLDELEAERARGADRRAGSRRRQTRDLPPPAGERRRQAATRPARRRSRASSPDRGEARPCPRRGLAARDARPLSRLRLAGPAVASRWPTARRLPLEQSAARRARRQGRGAPARASRGWRGLGRHRARLSQARPLPRRRRRLCQRRPPQGRDGAAAGGLCRSQRARRRRHRHRGGAPRLREDPEARARRPEPRFWLALAKEQDGKLADALADYKALLAEAPADAPWRAGARRAHRRRCPRRLARPASRCARAAPARRCRGRREAHARRRARR